MENSSGDVQLQGRILRYGSDLDEYVKLFK